MQARPETFRSSGAVVFGAISAAVSLALAVLTAVPAAGAPAWVPAALLLLTVVVYVAQVRPAVLMGESELVLRNMLQSVHLPWAAVEQVRIQQFLSVSAGGRDYSCAAVGRTRRQIRRDGPSGVPLPSPGADGTFSYGRLVESRIVDRAKEARSRRGVAAESPEQAAIADGVRVVRAWPEIVVLALAVVALVVAILV
jgi:hypothetical protein